VSYWQDPPDVDVANFLSAETVGNKEGEEQIVDVLVVGSGITGVSVAWGLLQGQLGKDGRERDEKKERIVMLEARQACSGATGRNGMFSFPWIDMEYRAGSGWPRVQDGLELIND
jgi:hypothetical protein